MFVFVILPQAEEMWVFVWFIRLKTIVYSILGIVNDFIVLLMADERAKGQGLRAKG
jgi:hypothetical protein